MKRVMVMGKILYFDIETSPNIALTWNIGNKVSLTHKHLIQDRKVICICWKWKGSKTIHHVSWDLYRQDDRPLLSKFVQEYNKADVVIGHNGDKFDIRVVNARLAYHNLPPLKEVTTIDTLKQSRQAFSLNSHKLEYLGEYFGVGHKVPTEGLELWKKVLIDKDPEALEKMVNYCKGDVRLLEQVHDKIKAYSKQRLHLGLLAGQGEDSCKACGSKNIKWSGNRIISNISYKVRRCLEPNCRHYWRTNIRSDKI